MRASILLVEDSAEDAGLVVRFLSTSTRVSIDVVHVLTLQAGVAAVHQRKFDAVLLDLSLPDAQGLAAVERLRSESPNLPIIVLSGAVDSEMSLAALAVGAQDYLVKGEETADGIVRAIRYAIERKRASLALQDHSRALEEANKEISRARDQALAAVRAKDAFLEKMSHELRTPLNGIIAACDLARDANQEATVEELLEIISTSGLLLEKIVNSILTFADSQRGAVESETTVFWAEDLIKDATVYVAEQRGDEGGGLSTTLDASAANRKLRAGYARLLQVVRAVLDNAMTFDPEADIRLAIAIEESRSLLRIEVTDRGVGIPSEMLEEVFAPFVQVSQGTTRRFDGVGLGLTVSRAIAASLGGEITLDSQLGQGTCVCLKVPVSISLPPRREGEKDERTPS